MSASLVLLGVDPQPHPLPAWPLCVLAQLVAVIEGGNWPPVPSCAEPCSFMTPRGPGHTMLPHTAGWVPVLSWHLVHNLA